MDEALQRKLLCVDYHTYSSILDNAGLDFIVLSDEQLQAMPINDLRQLVRRMAEAARTPRT